MSKTKQDILKTVENPDQERDYAISHTTDEFTFLYPETMQPCFATVEVEYYPSKYCVEMMSLKQYLQTFRDEAHTYEAITNELADDLSAAMMPRRMTVSASFTVRGGIYSTVKVSVGDV